MAVPVCHSFSDSEPESHEGWPSFSKHNVHNCWHRRMDSFRFYKVCLAIILAQNMMCQETHRAIHAQAANLPSWSWPQQEWGRQILLCRCLQVCVIFHATVQTRHWCLAILVGGPIWSTWLSGVHIRGTLKEKGFFGLGVYWCGQSHRLKSRSNLYRCVVSV